MMLTNARPSTETYDEKMTNIEPSDKENKGLLIKAKPISIIEGVEQPNFVGNVRGQSGIRFGESKYDKTILEQDLSRLDAARADRQSIGRAFLNGVASRTPSVLTKLGAGFGYVAGGAQAAASGNIEDMVNNGLSTSLNEADEALRTMFPVYGSDAYNSDSLLSIMSSSKFWFDDVFDGLAFAASAFIPAGAIGKVGSLVSKLGTAGKVFNGSVPYLITAYNTVSEAGFEADDTYKAVLSNLLSTGEYTEQEARERAANAAKNTFTGNSGALLLSNFVETQFFLKAFGKIDKSMRKTVRNSIDDLAAITPRYGKEAGKAIAKGIAAEGLWEEGIQNAIQTYELSAAKGEQDFSDSIAGYANEWVNGFSTTEGQKSMMLGAIIGTFMGGGSSLIETKNKKQFISEFGDEWKTYVNDYIQKNDNLFKDRIGSLVDAEGNLDINKAVKSFYQTLYDKNLFDEATAAALNGDEVHHNFNKNIALGRYLFPFLSDEKHFDDTDDSIEYAINRISELENDENTDPEMFASFKEKAKKYKSIYDDLKKKNSRFDNSMTNPLEKSINGIVFKSLFYEEIKRDSLEEIKQSLPDEQKEAVEKLIEDSQLKTDHLMSKENRQKIIDTYDDINTKNYRREENVIKIKSLEQELAKEGLTEERGKEINKEINKLTYDVIEDNIIDGDGRINVFDILKDEQEREAKVLGLRDSERLIYGSRFAKKAKRDELMQKYAIGEADEKTVYESIINSESENSPLDTEDKNILMQLRSALSNKENEIDRDAADQFVYNRNILESGGAETIEELGLEEEEFNKWKEEYEKASYIDSILPKIDNALDKKQFVTVTGKPSTERKLQEIAANRFVKQSTEGVISSYKSNPEIFSNVEAVEEALDNLSIAEEGLSDAKRSDLRDSNAGVDIMSQIAKKRAVLQDILKDAIQNKGNKKAEDINAKINYGKTRGDILKNSKIFSLLEQYLDATELNKIVNDFSEDNNFIHIEKIVSLIKKLKPENTQELLDLIKAQRQNMIDEMSSFVIKTMDTNFDTNSAALKVKTMKMITSYMKDTYSENPSGVFPVLINSILLGRTESIKTRPIDRFMLNNNISELYEALKASGANEESGKRYFSFQEFLELVEREVSIESVDSFVKSLESELDTLDYLKNEKKNAFIEQKEGRGMAPSRQQRIAIFEILRWFKKKLGGASNGYDSFAYLQGLAGTGKTSVVARMVMKLSGVKAEDTFSIGNNMSASQTINESIGTTATKDITNIEVSDIKDNVELLFVDEIGAVLVEDFKRLVTTVKTINEERAKRGVKQLKVLAIGDPTQIVRAENNDVNPIQSRMADDTYIKYIESITPLTIPFRSDVNSIVDLQNAFHVNRNKVEGISLYASREAGANTEGTQAGYTRSSLISKLNAHKDNGKSKVIIVNRQEDIDKYRAELGDTIPGLEIMTYRDVQGKTFQEVYVDIDPSVGAVNEQMSDTQKANLYADRNRILYTATSRAKDYIFLLDHTGSFKNNVTPSVEQSKENNAKLKSDYQNTYITDVQNDVNIFTGVKVNNVKDDQKKTDTVKDDTTVKQDQQTKAETEDDPYYNIEDEEDDENQNDNILEKEEGSSEDVFTPEDGVKYHTVEHTSNIHNTTKSDYKTPYEKGDKVYYVKVKRGDKTYVEIFTPKKADVTGKSYYKIGVLTNEESVDIFGRTLQDIIEDDSIKANVLGASATFMSDIKEDKSSIVAEGKIAKTSPITYLYKKDKDTSDSPLTNIINEIKSKFERRGFKVLNSFLKIYRTKELKTEGVGGMEKGVPYLVFDIQRESKDGSGSIFQQYVKVSPRNIDREKDSSLVSPIIDFLDSVIKIEAITSKIKDVYKLGNTNFNSLVKEFRNNFQLNEDQTAIEEKTSDRISLSIARKHIPELTQEQFNEISSMISPVIKGFYGIGDIKVKMSQDEFDAVYLDKSKYNENNDFDKTYYVDKLGLYYALDKSGYIEVKKIHQKGERDVLINAFGKRKHLTEKGMLAAKGSAQIALGLIAKNNRTPGGVNIRVYKKVTSSAGHSHKLISGKSLLTSDVSNYEYISALRHLMKEENLDTSLFDFKNDDTLEAIETFLIESNVLTAESLSDLKSKEVSSPLTSESLSKALGFEDSKTESFTLKRPISIDEMETLAADPTDENFNEILESRFSTVVPTNLIIELGKQITKPKVTPDKKSKQDEDFDLDYFKNKLNDANNDILLSAVRNFESEKEKEAFYGKPISKEDAVKLISKQIKGIKKEEIVFVESIVNSVPEITEEAWGAYVNGVIYLQTDEKGLVGSNIAKHEVFHKVYNERLSKQERFNLKKAFASEFPETTSMSNLQVEEFMAEKYQVFAKGEYLPESSIIRTIFAKIRELFRFVISNKEYIESVFRDISNGLYKPKGLDTNGGGSNMLKDVFSGKEEVKLAKAAILGIVEKLDSEGINGYPVSKNELKNFTKSLAKAKAVENGKLLIEVSEEIELAKEEERLDKVAALEGIKDSFESLTKLYTKIVKYYDVLFDFVYPTWDIKNFGSDEDVLDSLIENEDLEDENSVVNISDDIMDWAKINMEGKVSAAAKQFMSNIKWYNADGTFGGYVNNRYAYITSLSILNDLQEYDNNFVEQVNEKLEGATNRMYLAVGKRIIDTYNDVRYGYVNGNEVNKKIKFLNEGTFVYSEDQDILEYGGIETLKNKGINFQVIEKSGYNTKEFVDEIISKTSLSKKELFESFSYFKKADTLRNVFSNILSQKERNPKIVEIVNNYGNKQFKHIVAKGRVQDSSIKDEIKASLANTRNAASAKSISEYVKNSFKDLSSIDDKVKAIEKFLTKIGLGHLIGEGLPKNADLVDGVIDKIDLIFAQSDIFVSLYSEDDTKKLYDEDSEDEKDLEKAKLEEELNGRINSLLNLLAKLIGTNQSTTRATSVKSLDGKTKYIFTVSGQMSRIFNILVNTKSSGLFKKASKGGMKKLTLPEFLSGSEYHKENIFTKGINTIFGIEDLEGTSEFNIGSGKSYDTQYKSEQYDNYMERSFIGQFLTEISMSPKNSLKYSQNLFTISNKPSNMAASVSFLNRSKSIEALNSMITQISEQKTIDSISGANKYKLVAFNVLADVLNKIDSTYAKPVYKDSKFQHYLLSKDAFEYISNKKNVEKLAEDAYRELLTKAKEVTDEFIESRINVPVGLLNKEKIQGIVDKESFKDFPDISTITNVRKIDPFTGEIVITKERIFGSKIKTFEDSNDILERVNAKYGQEFSDIDFAAAFLGDQNHDDLQPKQLIDNNYIEPIVAAFVVNDYINSSQLMQLVAGKLYMYKSDNDITKRISGAYAPGIRGVVGKNIGMPRTTNIAVFEDKTFNVGSDIRSFLGESIKMSKEDIDSIIGLFGEDKATFDYTDAQGFMLPERKEELISGFSGNYGVGNVSKPAYFHIDENGNQRMLKYSSIVLTDELCYKYETLRSLRDKMRKGGKDGNTVFGEIVFKTGVKIGIPSKLSSIDSLLSDPEYYIDNESGFEIDNIDYRLQLNPIHRPDSHVANPSQLAYFLNTLENNAKRATKVYTYVSKIIKENSDELFEDFKDNKKLSDKIKSVLRNGVTNIRTSEVFRELTRPTSKEKQIKTPWDYPGISKKLVTQISSMISKNTVEIKFKGTKGVLQTAFGTENLDEETKQLASTLSYKVKDLGSKEVSGDILYAEAIVPRGMLPKNIEEMIENRAGEIPEQFLYSDILGFRLPSSELHSAIPLKIVGFYDSVKTNVIIAPKEIVALHGSDYDVDALYMIVREYDENNEPIGYVKNEEGFYVFDHSADTDLMEKDYRMKYYRNGILDMFLESVSIEENRDRMMSPISMIDIKKEISRSLKARSKKKESRPDSSFILSRQRTHSSSFQSLSGVGIFANGIKTLAYLQRSGEGKQQPTIAPEYEDLIIKIGDKSFNSLVSNKKLWEDLDAFLNSAIDNVNEQDLPNINMTESNIKAFVAMRALGIDLSTAVDIFSQDFMYYMNRKGRIGDGLFLKSRNEIFKKYGIEISSEDVLSEDSISGKYGLRSEHSLLDIFNKHLKGTDLTEDEVKFVKVQSQIYNEFNKAMQIGEHLTRMSKMLNIVRQFPSTKEEIESVLELKESIIDDKKFPFDISEYLNNLPHVREALSSLEQLNKLFEDKFFLYSPVVNKAIDKIYANKKISFSQDKLKNEAFKKDEFIKFMLLAVDWDRAYQGFAKEEPFVTKSGFTLYNERAFVERLFDNVELLKKSPLTKDNLFISGVSIGRVSGGKKVINFAPAANMSYDDIIDYENAFDDLLYYEIKNGKVVKKTTLGDPLYTMGFSKIQKDFMRYLIIEHGLAYNKNNYGEVIPTRMMVIFQRRYGYIINKVLTDKKAFNQLTDLFEVQVAMNNAGSLPKIKSDEKEVFNPDDKFKKYILDTDDIYADFVKLPVVGLNKDGEEESVIAKSKEKALKYVSSYVQTESGQRPDIFKRVYFDEKTGKAYYQKIGKQSLRDNYSVHKVGNQIEYDIEEAFRPDIRNIQTEKPEEGLPETKRKIRVGSTISLTAFSDPSRQKKYYYKVKSVKKVKVKEEELFKYSLEMVEKPMEAIVGKYEAAEYKESNFKPELRNYYSLEELNRIKNSNHPLADIAKLLAERPRKEDQRIYMSPSLPDIGRTTSTTKDDVWNPTKVEINPNLIKSQEYFDEVVVHEEIHRYVQIIEDLYNKNKGTIAVTKKEADFIEAATELYNVYMASDYQKMFADERPKRNVNEFIAHGLTNPEFMKHLDSIVLLPAKSNKSALSLFVEAVARLFGKATAYKALRESFDKLMNTPEYNMMDIANTDPEVVHQFKKTEVTQEDLAAMLKACKI